MSVELWSNGTFLWYLQRIVLSCLTIGILYLLQRLLRKPRGVRPSEELFQTIGTDLQASRRLPLPRLTEGPEVQITVVIPAYNEAQRIKTMLNEAITYLDAEYNKAGDWEILIVDDGSTDNTSYVALQWAKHQIELGTLEHGQLRVCRLEINRGKGGAVTHHIRGKYAIFVDADGASKFADLGLLFSEMQKIERDGLGIASGSRAHMVFTDAVVKRSPLRNLLMHAFHTFIRVLGVRHIKDTQCGFKLFSRKACEYIFPNMHIEKYAFDVEVFLLAHYLRIPVVEVPVTWHEVDGSKMNLVADSLNMAWDLVLMRFGYTSGLWNYGYPLKSE